MGGQEIKIDVSVVESHTEKIKTQNKDLRKKSAKSIEKSGTTNFAAYTKGIACGSKLQSMTSSLSKKIDKDCKNVNSAADIINEMDKNISGELNKKGIYTSK